MIFTGFLDAPALAQLFFSSDIFVHPSELTSEGNREGVPNSLLEAMAAGLPSVATRHGGIPEAISDRVSGLLVDEADPEALFRALEAPSRSRSWKVFICVSSKSRRAFSAMTNDK